MHKNNVNEHISTNSTIPPIEIVTFDDQDTVSLQSDFQLEMFDHTDSERTIFDGVKATILSYLIEARNWGKASDRLKDFPEEASTEIIINCFQSGACKGLPLHLACTLRPLPPSSFLLFLISFYPSAVSRKEFIWGMLPLHFAVMPLKEYWNIEESRKDMYVNNYSELQKVERHTKFVQLLVNFFPEGLSTVETFHGKLPIHIATSAYAKGFSYVEVVRLLANQYPESIYIQDYCGETPLALAYKLELYHKLDIPEQRGLISPRCVQENITYDLYNDSVSYMFQESIDLMKGVEERKIMNDVQYARIMSVSSKNLPTTSEIDVSLPLNSHTVTFKMSAKLKKSKSKKKYFVSKKRHPFFEIHILEDENNINSWKMVHRSYPIFNETNPSWEPSTIEIINPSYDLDGKKDSEVQSVKISIYNCDLRKGQHKLLGEAYTTVQKFLDSTVDYHQYDIIKPLKKKYEGRLKKTSSNVQKKKAGLITIMAPSLCMI